MKLPFELQESEEVLVFSRRHWMYLYPRLVALVMAALIPLGAAAYVTVITIGFGSTGGKVIAVAMAAWGLFWAIRIYFRLYRYNNDLWVVTSQRIVDSTRRHWFHHQMASADLVDVEDIAVRKEGILPTFFNFGDVRCQTAGEQPNFILAGVPVPGSVLQTIDAARDAARRRLGGRIG